MKFNNNKFKLIILFCFCIVIAFKFYQKYSGFTFNGFFYRSLTAIGITKKSYRAIPDILEISAQEGFDYFKKDQMIIEQSLKKLGEYQNYQIANHHIPYITHHVYFAKNSEQPINIFFTEKLSKYYQDLNNISAGWQHYIWTNFPEIIPQKIKNIPGVIIKQPIDLKDSPLYPVLILEIAQGIESLKHYAAAADILRVVALEKFGGIYSDMDYEIYSVNDLFNLINRFDFIAGRELVHQFSYYGNSFFAAVSNHPVLEKMIDLYVRNYSKDSKPLYLSFPRQENDRVYFNGPPLLTFAYFAANNQAGYNDIILPAWMLFNIKFARIKNINCDFKKMNKEKILSDFVNLEVLINNYRQTPINWCSEPCNKAHTMANIYFDITLSKNYPIIGADMFCGSWVGDGKGFKRIYYWFWQ